MGVFEAKEAYTLRLLSDYHKQNALELGVGPIESFSENLRSDQAVRLPTQDITCFDAVRFQTTLAGYFRLVLP